MGFYLLNAPFGMIHSDHLKPPAVNLFWLCADCELWFPRSKQWNVISVSLMNRRGFYRHLRLPPPDLFAPCETKVRVFRTKKTKSSQINVVSWFKKGRPDTSEPLNSAVGLDRPALRKPAFCASHVLFCNIEVEAVLKTISRNSGKAMRPFLFPY